MISGVFNDREARIPLVVYGPDGQSQGIAAVIDTGFTGYLTLPLAVLEALGLEFIGRAEAVVGDGSVQVFDLYEASAVWGDERLTIDVAAAETEPLLGMGLIYGHDLRIQAIEDGLVTIEKLMVM